MPGFFDGFSQDEKDLTVLSSKIFIQPTQLGGMATALHSNEFTHEEYIDIIFTAEISQRNFCPVTGRETECGCQRA